MLSLCYSNRMEVLVAPLAERVRAARADDPMTPVTLVVPNRAVAQYLRFRLAEALGIAANLRFVFLRHFLSEAVAEGGAVQVLDADTLQLLLFARLRDDAFLAGPELGPVRAWLDVAHDRPERELRALQLSGELARLFEEYSYSRGEMLGAWPGRATLQDTTWAAAERWQRALWNAVFDRRGAVRPEIEGQLSLLGEAPAPEPEGPRRMLLPQGVAATAELAVPEVLHVFGLSYVAPAFARILAGLAEHPERSIFVYALNPCLEFWEDVDASRLPAMREGWARRAERAEVLDAADPFQLERGGDTPALSLWGRPGREYIRLLNQLTRCDFVPLFLDPAARFDGPPSLLARLQRDILLRAPERGPDEADHAPDGSVRFFACPGLRRQVEVVADEIWRLVAASEADPQPLRFHDIAVMVTDTEREACLTHIEAVFEARDRLPFNVIDRRLAGQSRVVEAFDRLLALPGGELAFDDVVSLLTHPCVGGGLGEVDLDRWRAWCAELNVRFGADRAALEDTYFRPHDVHNWDQALRRLALGAFMTGPRSGDERPFELGDRSWSPFEAPPEATDDVGRLIGLVRGLIEDARALDGARLEVAEWCALFTRVLHRWILPRDEGDERALGRCVDALTDLAAADLEGQSVSFPVARELVRGRLDGLDSGRGHHQADGVVVSSLLPMRAVPFRVVFVLGMGAGEFPANERNNPLDLRRARRRAGDVTPPERDRYLFLETLLAARDALVLAYVARDGKTGEPLEPSAVVRELQFILQGYVPREALAGMTERFPVSPFEPAAVEGGEEVAAEAIRGARVRALRASLERHLGHDLPPPDELYAALAAPARAALAATLRRPTPPTEVAAEEGSLELPLAAVVRFLQSPLQGGARYALGMVEPDEPIEATDERLAFERPDRLAILREAFWGGAGDPEATREAYEASYRRRLLKGDAPLGVFAEKQQKEDLEQLDTWLAHVKRMELPPLDTWQAWRVGRATEFADFDALLPSIELEVPVEDGRTRTVSLHGRLQPFQPDVGAALRCLSGRSVDEKHFLPGFVSAVALAALGQTPEGAVLRAVTLPAGPGNPRQMERRYRLPAPEPARAWLRDVVADLLGGAHEHRLPIECVVRWNRDLRHDANARPYLRWTDQTSADYGPVSDPRGFPVAPPDLAHRIVERRLAVWFQNDVT